MVFNSVDRCLGSIYLSVLALSSRFDGLFNVRRASGHPHLSVLALSSRFDGRSEWDQQECLSKSFSTRSVESF